MPSYNIYCDESCHLENDHQSVMVLGGIWIPEEKKYSLAQGIRQIKEKHDMGRHREIKWNKVSKSKIDYYVDIVNFFFDSKDMHFRGLVVTNKNKLDHIYRKQSHDAWYYKMYFTMLKQIFEENNTYKIYLDIKDTRGGRKIKNLRDVMCNSLYDFDQNIIKNAQLIRSEESEFVQIADLFIGALAYFHRNLEASAAKLKIVEVIKERSGHSLNKNTLPREEKFNLLIWEPQAK